MAISNINEINEMLKGKIISRLRVNTVGQVELWYKNKGAKKEAGYALIIANASVLMQKQRKPPDGSQEK
ncbi:unnamed protein product [marine sediment metagenome]|uniref:Uncharacterized protein n=1 Tax=marine sediment metagenome TaxID=412755 RepID=X0U4T3_9ZZZZ